MRRTLLLLARMWCLQLRRRRGGVNGRFGLNPYLCQEEEEEEEEEDFTGFCQPQE